MRYLAALERTSLDGWSREEQVAFWLNAYDALVLRTVIDRYPIAGTAREYPSKSIRQIPGAFERTTHRVAGRTVTLDAIERDILGGFGDPRVFLAIGRGSVGGGRLRSEAFTGAGLEAQLQQVASEFPTRRQLLRVDTGGAAAVDHAHIQLARGELRRRRTPIAPTRASATAARSSARSSRSSCRTCCRRRRSSSRRIGSAWPSTTSTGGSTTSPAARRARGGRRVSSSVPSLHTHEPQPRRQGRPDYRIEPRARARQRAGPRGRRRRVCLCARGAGTLQEAAADPGRRSARQSASSRLPRTWRLSAAFVPPSIARSRRLAASTSS